MLEEVGRREGIYASYWTMLAETVAIPLRCVNHTPPIVDTVFVANLGVCCVELYWGSEDLLCRGNDCWNQRRTYRHISPLDSPLNAVAEERKSFPCFFL